MHKIQILEHVNKIFLSMSNSNKEETNLG